ncbi:MAG: SMP-30/gluconolactonase/LRE family protein [Candidatus Poribacteria bacterium]|nr:SMP-30/gluconolactonase/LRE family protein [Candidatus Poribacteria bacterium]MDE0505477.1 SMP-30/gluconolactonase/LRE family protein [Candidatus Poribacteria bacterium]
MSIDVHSDEVLNLVDANAQVEKLGTGCQFTEGPVWNSKQEFLLFSDIPADQMKKWTAESGITDYRVPSGKSNGLTYDSQGRLIACEHANRRVSRTEVDGEVVTIASHYDGKRLNSPNDVVVKSDGGIYFTDPPYGLTAEFGALGEKELDFQGVYRLSPDDDGLTLLVDDFDCPNGLCFAPEESVLYINDSSDRMHVRAFDVQPDGTIANGRIFAEIVGEGGAPDGMKTDQDGNVYVTGPGGVWIFDASGKRLGVINTPEGATNIGWGESDWKTLYIVAKTSLYRIRCKVAGVPVC